MKRCSTTGRTPCSQRAAADKQNAGFTLVEALIAATLMLLVFGGLLMAFNSARRASYASANYLDALAEARAELETIAGMSYNSITNYGPVAVSNGPLFFIGALKQCEVIQDGTNNFKTVTVTIIWTNAAGGWPASLSVSTLVSQD